MVDAGDHGGHGVTYSTSGLRLRRFLEWRYWPLVLLLALIAIALLGQSFQLGQEKGAASQYRADHAALNAADIHTAAEREAKATDMIARFTVVLATVGIGQLIVIFLQLRSDERQQSWIHRPRMRVRFVDTWRHARDATWQVVVICVNIGDSEARIHRFTCDVARRDPRTLEWIDTPGINDPGSRAKTVTHVAPGGHIVERPTSTHVFSDSDFTDLANGRHDLYVVGLVRYEDKNGVTRRTGFLWKRHRVTDLFDPVEEHRWSYED